jgi:thioredoxin 1
MFGPVIEEAAAEVEGLTVGKVNVDEEGPLAERYGIMSIPTVILFLNGRDVKRETGAMSKEDLIGFIKT